MADQRAAAPLILVVGMHRSGSSLLGSVLAALGIGLPGPLIPGDHHNPEGYFERADITAIQEELLIDLVRWWPAPEGVLPLPRGWLTSSRGQRASRALRRLLAAEAAKARGPWAIKDPRISLLLPLWRQVAEELGIPLQLVLAVRDPAEVVVSLLGRDADKAGMTRQRAQQLWWRHQHQVLEDGAGLPLLVVPYADWFLRPEEQIAAVARFCGLGDPDPQRTAQAMACIRPEHHRSRRNQLQRRLDPSLPALYDQLRRAAHNRRRIGVPDPTRRWLLLCTRSRLALGRGLDRALNRYPFPLHHPWARAARALEADQELARQRLETWQARGLTGDDVERLAALRRNGLPGDDPAALDGCPLEGPLKVCVVGGGADDWHVHLWLERLPTGVQEPWQLSETHPAQARFVLHLQPVAVTASDPELLLSLTRYERVFDPDPERVRLLRILGVAAEPIDPAGRGAGGWLLQPGDRESISAMLGLPAAEQLQNPRGSAYLCLGSSTEPAWLQDPLPALRRIPSFPPDPAGGSEQARLLASWLESCRRSGLQLVRLNPPMRERQGLAAEALDMAVFSDPISPAELEQELAWMAAGRPAEPSVQTPSSDYRLRWSREQGTPAAAVCISLHNYGDRIEAALDSCAEQTLADLELVVVDDGSSDGGSELCERWLERRGNRFCRALLVEHAGNAGLAASRNTAFALATSPWCFVLDADNVLNPEAVERCLAIASSSNAQVAVVHPLVRRLTPDGRAAGLVGGGQAWQRDLLMAGNVVDAMALIRRTAWQQVGGYSHIPGGWEDFDFWCSLIDAGFHGVLCPEILATYQIHADSMLQATTHSRLRRISRLVQQRHPWLKLEMAELKR